MIFMIVLAVVAVVVPIATNTSPTLGLDLQGGFSVVLQAKEVNGQLPTEEAVEKAKDIIRQRVDGLGVAEPDITRQGRTVVVQLPGVRNRSKAEAVVGCTARLEFRPVLAVTANPNAATGSTSTTAPGSTSTTEAGATSTTTAGATTTSGGQAATTVAPSTTAASPGGDGDESGIGAVGVSPGEGALPSQFAPTTTTTLPPTTTTTVPPSTTTIAPSATTTTEPVTTTTTASGGSTGESGGSGSAGCGGTGQKPVDASIFGAQGAGGEAFPSQDGQAAYLLGPVGFSGDALSSANATIQQGQWQVLVKVKSSQKAKANAAFNACYSGQPTCPGSSSSSGQSGSGAIAIVLDGEVISAPTVNGANLADKEFTISGGFSESEAKELALVLRYGSLPVVFEQAALQQVSATLGKDSLRAGLVAGLIGIAALAIYMILYYRGFGLVVVASLLVWSAVMWGLVCLLSEQQGLALTLAGITGIIVSVGTTVDTYVVVFERVKDLIREGKSVRAATEIGYQSGIRTVFTANGAAFIGAFLLWWLTVGPVRGFAYFLGISVILDLAVAVLFTRPLILLLSRSPRFAQAKFFGIGSSTDQHVPVKGATS
ncbi:MAG: protein translocase subunit SecD [Acidimicrobiales bacterium]|nr:protein translocase subunit SecD [Acidimicrobiales bacterium]